MLYELVAIVRPGDLAAVKGVARATGSYILNNGGVVRGITNWGPFSLPKVVRSHQAKYTHGHYFVMQFDSSPKVQTDIRTTMKADPRMIRCAVVKMGKGTLDSIKDIDGKVQWADRATSTSRRDVMDLG
ncbi:MAG: hypothetical protein M1814_003104 [Vezdaea aestivalis]|nr:MAG: hypothetical protein M1814_003104 [Vezdaea aestivalis]